MKRVVVVVAVLAVVVWGVYAFIGGNGSPPQAREGAQTAAQSLPPVKAPNVVVADAKVVPVQSAGLSVATNGVVAEVLVREGERVKAGDVLLRVENARQEAAVAQARAQLRRAEAQLAQLNSGARPQEIDQAQAAVEAARAQLAKVRVTGPPLDITIAEAEVRRAEAQLELLTLGARPENIAAAEAEVVAAEAALQQAEAAMRETELRAPFDGTVASIAPKVGEYVTPGQAAVWLADDSTWKLETEDLTELGVVRVDVGSPVMVTIDALPDVELTGRVESIKPLGENRLGDITYRVVIVLDEHEPRLRWNMTASVTIHEPQ